MTTFLRRRLWPAFALLARHDRHHRRRLPGRRDGRRPGRLPDPGQRLDDRRRRQDRRLEPHRPGLQRRRSTSGAGRRRPARTATTRAARPGSNLGPTSQALIDRITRRGRRAARRERRRAGPGRPRHDLRVRPRSGHQPGRGRVPGRPRRRGPRHDRGRTSGPPSRATRSSRCSASSASRASTSCCSTWTSTGCCSER